MEKSRAITAVKVVLCIACLYPLLRLVIGFFTGRLGPSPVEFIRAITGRWAIRLLIITLTVSPLVEVSRWNMLIAFRKPLGVFCLFYALLHFLNYLGLEYLFNLDLLLVDVRKTIHIYFGFAALLAMIPLGLTSIRGWAARLEPAGWKAIHGLIYGAALGSAAHLLLQGKILSAGRAVYVVLLIGLLGYRVARFILRRVHGKEWPRKP